MISELVIRIVKEESACFEYDTKISVSQDMIPIFSDGSYTVCIDVTVDEKLESVFNETNIQEMLDDMTLYYDVTNPDDSSYSIYNFVTKLLKEKRLQDLYNKTDRVRIDGTNEEVLQYINDNPFIQGKTIVLNRCLDVSLETYLDIKESFCNYPDMLFSVMGNIELVTFDEYEKTVLAISEIVNKIKNYDYSPLEQALYAYDLVRNRFYVKESDEELGAVSRDLTSVLLGDKIVCLGFANIYNTVLSMLGFNSMVFKLLPKEEGKSGHARVFTYIKDEKYDIDGLYFFDPTFDCKKNDSNDYLSCYKYFARTMDQMKPSDRGRYNYPDYNIFDSEEVYEWADGIDREHVGITDLLGNISIPQINKIAKMLDIKPIGVSHYGIDKSQIVDILIEACNKANMPIGTLTFLEALYNVRKNQYYEEPSKYVLEMQELVDILVNSKIVCDITAEDKLFAAIFGSEYVIGSNRAQRIVNEFAQKHDVERDIERVKLARTLRFVLESKQDESKDIKKHK